MLSTIVDELDRVTPIRQIRATGGVFRSTVWREVLAAALGKPLVTLHPEQHDHALKEVDRAALAVAREPEQVVDILRYVMR